MHAAGHEHRSHHHRAMSSTSAHRTTWTSSSTARSRACLRLSSRSWTACGTAVPCQGVISPSRLGHKKHWSTGTRRGRGMLDAMTSFAARSCTTSGAKMALHSLVIGCRRPGGVEQDCTEVSRRRRQATQRALGEGALLPIRGSPVADPHSLLRHRA